MKYSTKLSDALHILAFLSMGAGQRITSAKIAESVKTNPAYIRQLMAALKSAGIIASSQGQANAELTRRPGEITVLDVYRAIEGNIARELGPANTIWFRIVLEDDDDNGSGVAGYLYPAEAFEIVED